MEKRIKKSFICSPVKNYKINTVKTATYLPEAGDVAVFEVLETGKHEQMQGDKIRNVKIFPGDLIMAAFGTRYATEQFEGYLPETFMNEYHILGAGGTVGILHSMHSKFRKTGPTRLRLIGYATDKYHQVINTKKMLAHNMKSFSGAMSSLTKIILSVGSSMDSGKTTTAAYCVHGLAKKGYKTAFIKLTGTVFTKDRDLAYDMGAEMAIDFSELGFPSTYMCSQQELLDLFETLLSQVYVCSPDYVVIEIADGIYQRETEMLLRNNLFMQNIETVIFSAGDSLSAVQGVAALEKLNVKVNALSGLFTASPLLIEEVRSKVTIPIYTIEELAEGIDLAVLQTEMRSVI